VNHHWWNIGTPRPEVKTASSGLPDIKKLDAYCKKVCLRRLQEPKPRRRGNKPPRYRKNTTMKRCHQTPIESSRPIKKPKHYACPEGKAFIDVKGGRHAIKVLLDSGSNIFLMNQDTAQRLEIPTEARDPLLKITTFDGEIAPRGGTFYTHPILLEIGANGHRSMLSCEIANAGRYDLIIPFGWWDDEYPLKNIADPMRRVFEEAKCHAHVEDEAVADIFEWDETVAYDKEAHYGGRIEREEEGGVPLETLPKPYWQYKELFEEKKTKRLASQRTFDHAINLKQGPNLPDVGPSAKRA